MVSFEIISNAVRHNPREIALKSFQILLQSEDFEFGIERRESKMCCLWLVK